MAKKKQTTSTTKQNTLFEVEFVVQNTSGNSSSKKKVVQTISNIDISNIGINAAYERGESIVNNRNNSI